MVNSGLNIGANEVGGERYPSAHGSGQIFEVISFEIAFIDVEANKKFSDANFASIKSAFITSFNFLIDEI